MEIPNLYVPATRLPLKSHRPPQPFGKTDYKHIQTPGVPYISPETVGHLNSDDLIYAVHPRERYEPPNNTDDPSIVHLPDWYTDNQDDKIKIVCPLSTGRQGAQAVLCEVLRALDVLWKKMGHKSNDLPRKVVAKISDPLHYRGHIDPVAEADREYAQEAAAYIQLHGKRDTKVYTDKPDLVPKFYGTWTTDITFNHFRKTGMSAKDRAKTLKAEASKRKLFDAAVAAAKNGDSSSKQSKLSPHSGKL
ncbi:hypothetical protein F5X68DRAFT_226995 [Plectosphaerella plurivora]|uniref:Uncharacterized protein n=1 Tax=Plectosphaerella plurivora TaxID=936078 RepID=A0A9P8VL77_9PEZI|nr:hypothetical protein F5X68DRAFT_226995 [Plectosphaerella plurivora]